MAEEQNGIVFQIEGKDYALDEFTLGDLEWLEDELGGGDVEAAIVGHPMKAAVRVVYLVKRRDDPNFTLEDARGLSLTIFNEHTNGNGNGAGPPQTAAKKKAARSTRVASGASS